MNADLTYDGRIPEELTMNLELEVRKLTEAYCITHNIPIKRAFRHDELISALNAINEIEAAKLKVPTAVQIDAVMMEAIKGAAT